MDVGRQILDQQLVDRTGLAVGKVDGIMMELRDGTLPRLTAVLTGGHLFAWRLHPQLQGWARWLTRRWGPGRPEPLRIPWSKVMKIGVDVKVDIEAADAMPWERWVRERIIGRIPGSGA
jgi:sporulation protein YlmC with PRC-barrel domain